MKRNIIIGGTVRAGKSTLAERIVKELGYSICESDTIVNAFDKAFPELGIVHRRPEEAREKYKPFLHEILTGFYRTWKYQGIPTVFPGSQFLPSTIDEYSRKEHYIVIFLGINDVTGEELLSKIREMDTEKDWTFKENDEKLLKHCNKIIEESKTLENECKKYGFYYFNTFADREKVFDGIIEMLKEQQKDG